MGTSLATPLVSASFARFWVSSEIKEVKAVNYSVTEPLMNRLTSSSSIIILDDLLDWILY